MPTAPEPQTGAADSAAEVDLTGQTLGDYHVVRRIGSGGMGQVYLAEQLSLKRKVALKTLKPSLASNPTARQRFKIEAENVARATHANIVQVYNTGEFEGGIPYIALEYVEGRNLRDYLARKGPPDLMIALSIMRQVAAALQRASELGLIHRDIKPDNILLTRKGEAKVTDFGLSRVLVGDQPAMNLTASGVTMGTPLYMSPEQVEGKPVDARTDIYSFGVTCYHLLAGHPPYTGTTAFEVALKHVRGEPTPLSQHRPDLPPNLIAIVHKMMAKEPAQRYQTCRELLRDLARLRDSLHGQTSAVMLDDPGSPIENSAVTLVPIPSTAVPVRPPSGNGWGWFLYALAATLALSGGVALSWYVHRPGELPAVQAAPADPDDADPTKRELALREAARQYLGQGARAADVAVGFALARDLGLLYLERDKLKEASDHFTELENHTVRSYQILGKYGKAVVQGLRANRPEEALASTVTLRDLFITAYPLFSRPMLRRTEPEIVMWTDPRVRFWASQALWYNKKNGVAESEYPALLARLRDTPARP